MQPKRQCRQWLAPPDRQLGRRQRPSRRRDCHVSDTPFSSTLKHLLKGEGCAANGKSLADGYSGRKSRSVKTPPLPLGEWPSSRCSLKNRSAIN